MSDISKRMYLSLRSLYVHRSYTPQSVRIDLVQSILFPILDYCDTVSTDMSAECIGRLQVLQNNCIRYIFDVPKFSGVTEYYKKLKWLKIKERRLYHVLVLTHKILNTQTPKYLYDKFTLMSNIHSRTTRSHPLYLQNPICKNKSFVCIASTYWNKLPPLIMSIQKHDCFKQKVYNILLNKNMEL